MIAVGTAVKDMRMFDEPDIFVMLVGLNVAKRPESNVIVLAPLFMVILAGELEVIVIKDVFEDLDNELGVWTSTNAEAKLDKTKTDKIAKAKIDIFELILFCVVTSEL